MRSVIRSSYSACERRSHPAGRGSASVPQVPARSGGRRLAELGQGRLLDTALHAPHQVHEYSRDVRVEISTRTVLDVLEYARRFPRPAVGPVRPQRVVDVADVHQGARTVALAADVARGIPAAVEHDVMLERHYGGEIELLPTREDELRPLLRVPLHHGAFVVAQLARLVEDVQWNARLAEIV